MPARTSPTILVVDDEPLLAETLALILRHAGYSATAVNSGEEALSLMSKSQPSLVVSDVVMPGLNGIELARSIRTSYPNCHVVLFSGNADTHALLEAAKTKGQVFEVLAKPVPPSIMLARIASLLGTPADKDT